MLKTPIVPASQPISVLVVDDDEDDLMLLYLALCQLVPTLRVYAVGNGEEALQYLRSCTHQPALVITDMHMPLLDGAGLITCLRQLPGSALILAVVLSSVTSAADWQRCCQAGANAYRAKPQHYPELIDMAKELIHSWLPANQRHGNLVAA